jgi:hypothetical protein
LLYLFEKFEDVKEYTEQKYDKIDELNQKDPLLSAHPNVLRLKDLTSVIKE